jgi:NAD(P)-dependent dehydrogenase (short-subunit alcohol dehydrogenase family)
MQEEGPVGRFDGKVAVITGGARGQGRSHAIALAREGARVALWDIANDATADPPFRMASREDLDETARLVKDLGAEVLPVVVDLRSHADTQSAVAQTVDAFGGIDYLVAQQGAMPLTREVWNTTEEDWNSILAVNLTATFVACKYTIPKIIERGRGGAIVLTSSTAGLVGFPYLVCYAAAKHGILGLGKGLANELGPYGIRCNMVCPGAVDTPMVASFAEANDMPSDAMWKQFDGMDLLGAGLVKPEESTTPAVLYLLSDDARWVTGHTMVVDAGASQKPNVGNVGG